MTVTEDAKWCRVFLDGEKQMSFEDDEFGINSREHAERYAAGLRAEIAADAGKEGVKCQD